MTTTNEQTTAPEGHDQKMVERFDQSQQTTTQTTQETTPKTERPAHIPEKFWDAATGQVRVDDLVKSYSELEKGRAKPEEKPAQEQKPGLTIETQQQAQETLTEKGLDYQKYVTEFLDKGQLSDDSYKELTDKGIPKEMVDAYVAGQVAQASAFENEIKTSVGGAEKFNEMSTWASKNLTPGELSAYNAAVDSGNADQIKLAVAGINAKFTAAVGSDPQLLGGSTTSASGDVFRDQAEMKEAMRDPRYKTSEAYRQEVRAKLGRSSIL
jgi:hypothetical protein